MPLATAEVRMPFVWKSLGYFIKYLSLPGDQKLNKPLHHLPTTGTQLLDDVKGKVKTLQLYACGICFLDLRLTQKQQMKNTTGKPSKNKVKRHRQRLDLIV